MKVLDKDNVMTVQAGEHVLLLNPKTGKDVEMVVQYYSEDGELIHLNTADSRVDEYNRLIEDRYDYPRYHEYNRLIEDRYDYPRYHDYICHMRLPSNAAVMTREGMSEALAKRAYTIG